MDALFPKNKKTTKKVAQLLLIVILLQYLGIMAMANFDLARIAVGQWSLAYVVTLLGSFWVLLAISWNKLSG